MSAQNSIGFQDYPAPIGAVMYWAGKSIIAAAPALPTLYGLPDQITQGGWIIPSGQSLSKTEYPDLWYLQQSLGAVDAGDTFLAPDLTTPLPTPATLGYNFLLPTQLIAGNTINTDFGILPPTITASATLTQANLPVVVLNYTPSSLQYQATFINPQNFGGTLYTDSSTTDRTGGDDYKYVRDDTSFTNTNIINQFANLNKYTLTYENLNPPTPINATGQINPPLAPLVVPPHVELVPLMKASYSTTIPPFTFPAGYTALPY
jgi:hypothetical protein